MKRLLKVQRQLLSSIVIFSLCISSGCGEGPANNANSRVNSNLSTQHNINSNMTANNVLDEVQQNLDACLEEWAPEYKAVASTGLSDIWTEKGKNPWTYYPRGAQSLVNAIRSNGYFGGCPDRVAKLTPKKRLTRFRIDGDIQTVRDLYENLYACPEEIGGD